MSGRRRYSNGKRLASTTIQPWRPPKEQQPLNVVRAVAPVGKEWNEKCIEAWRENSVARGLSAQTIKGYDCSLRAYMDWCSLNDFSVLDVGPKELRAYFDNLRQEEPMSIGAIGNRFTALSSLYDFLVEIGEVPDNFVPYFRRRYLQIPLKESRKIRFERKPFLSVRQMRRLVKSISDAQEKVLIVLAAKTGVRVSELVAIDVADIDWKSQSVNLKKQRKRTHLVAFFDMETERLLKKWLSIREHWTDDDAGPLFLGLNNQRMTTSAARKIVTRVTTRIGLYKPGGEQHEKVRPHTFRHFFTTHMYRAGMSRDHIRILRGDSLGQTIDLYLTTDWDTLRREYLKCVPLIAGGPKPPPERRREQKTKNPSFGNLTPQEAARRGHQPGETVLQLRGRLANDLRKGKLRRPAYYVDWLTKKKGLSLSYARPLVSNQLRILGVPPLNRGPQKGPGWQAHRKTLRLKVTKPRRSKTK